MKKFYKENNESIPEIIYSDTQPPVNADGNSYFVITDQEELDVLYYKQNKKRKDEGKIYVGKFKVKVFGVAYRDEVLNADNISYLYHKLWQLLIRLEDGNFDSAIHLLENELNVITQEDIDNGYTQSIHDKLLSEITNLNQ